MTSTKILKLYEYLDDLGCNECIAKLLQTDVYDIVS